MSAPFMGTFHTRYGILKLIQQGRVVFGDYGDIGIVEGRVNPQSGALEGTFVNSSKRGRILFHPTREGFDGLWTFRATGPMTTEWDGTRVDDDRPDLENAYFEGSYETDYAPVRLRQNRGAVYGDYGGAGTIDAQFDESDRRIVGTFTNGDARGRIDFSLTDDGFRGLWAWNDEVPRHRWNGTKVSWARPDLPTYDAKNVDKGAVSRGLIVVSMLEVTSTQYIWLYEFLDAQGVSRALSKLGSKYGRIATLEGQQATFQRLLNEMRVMAQDTRIREIDLIVHCHGYRSGAFKFAPDDRVTAADFRAALEELGIRDRLRMFYTTACWGARFVEEAVAGGFTCASGAKGVNANAGTEFPRFLDKWGEGKSFKIAMDHAYQPRLAQIAARGAKLMGFDDVDSEKVLFGDTHSTINSVQRE